MTTPDENKVLGDEEAIPGDGVDTPFSHADAEAEAASSDRLDAGLAEEAAEAVAKAEAEMAAEAEPTADELVAKAQAEAAEWKDKYLRLHAEWDTYRRRTQEQRVADKALAAEKLVGNLIPLIDDFERTISYAEEHGETGLLDGVKAVSKKLMEVLAKEGLVALDPAGEPFDALEAQAVAVVPDDSVPDETVAQVYQKGYKLGTKVLRPAMVTVTSGGPKREN